MKKILTIASMLFAFGTIALFEPADAHAQSGSYCEGHRDGHRSGSDTFGMGYPGYPGCPGDPGSSGGNATPYQRGFAAGIRDITRQLCSRNPGHRNCR